MNYIGYAIVRDKEKGKWLVQGVYFPKPFAAEPKHQRDNLQAFDELAQAEAFIATQHQAAAQSGNFKSRVGRTVTAGKHIT